MALKVSVLLLIAIATRGRRNVRKTGKIQISKQKKTHGSDRSALNIAEEKCFKEVHLSPAPETDMEIVKDLFPPLIEAGGSGHDVKKRESYNDLKIQAAWKVNGQNAMLKEYISEVNVLNSKYKELGQSFSVKTPQHEAQKRAKKLGIIGENEYLLWKGSSSTNGLAENLCMHKPLNTDFLKNIFGLGRYFTDASDKADQYVSSTSNQFEPMFDVIGREDTCLNKLQESVEHQNQIYFLGLYRTYLGKYYEVGYEKIGGLQVYNSQPVDKREKRWYYRNPSNGEVKTLDEVGNTFNRIPPFVDSPQWNSLKVMSKTFEPDFSKLWKHHPFPTRYNEYVLHNSTPWALQYIIAYKRGRKEDPDTSECSSSLLTSTYTSTLTKYLVLGSVISSTRVGI